MLPRVGHPVPEIEGPDQDGQPFVLGQYRGRVVALLFWADW